MLGSAQYAGVVIGGQYIGDTTVPDLHAKDREQAEMERQYAICKQRGHVATIPGNYPIMNAGNPAVFHVREPAAPVLYKAEDTTSTEWATCWYCKKEYRFVTVTKIEEK